jgi:hypothetical protein
MESVDEEPGGKTRIRECVLQFIGCEHVRIKFSASRMGYQLQRVSGLPLVFDYDNAAGDFGGRYSAISGQYSLQFNFGFIDGSATAYLLSIVKNVTFAISNHEKP